MQCSILEISGGIAGDFLGNLLVDLGANVTKVISAGEKGIIQHPAPYAQWWPGLHEFLNSRKQMKQLSAPDGIRNAIVAELEGYDVLIIDTDGDQALTKELVALREAFPSLVVTAITPFGLVGPYQSYLGTSLTASAASGRMWCTGLPEREPLQTPLDVPHSVAGLIAAVGTITGLLARQSSGKGMVIDISEMEAFAEMGSFVATICSYRGEPWRRAGNKFPQANYPCKDGFVGLCMLKEEQWPLFGALLGREDVIADPRFVAGEQRDLHVVELMEIIRAWASTQSVMDVVEIGQALRIPTVPVSSAGDLLKNPQLAHRGAFRDVSTSDGRKFLAPNVPFRFHNLAKPACDSVESGKDGSGAGRPDAHSSFQPFAGMRVLDLSHYFAGPTVTYFLAMLGAEVVKVESCKYPDGYRFMGALNESSFWEKLPTFNSVNLNKYGIALDVSRPNGRQVLEQLIRRSDVLVENFSPRVLHNLGLTDDILASLNSNLIHLSMPAYGSDGPWRDFVGFAPSFEQAGGLSYVTGYPDGEPLIVGLGWGMGDPTSGYWGVLSLLKALLDRAQRKAWPRRIDLSQVEASMSVCPIPVIALSRDGTTEERRGNTHPQWFPYGVFPSKGDDAWVAIAVRTEQEWCSLAGLIDLAAQDYPDVQARRQNDKRIVATIGEWTASLSAQEAFERLQAAGVPSAPAFTSRDLLEDRHLRERDYFTEVDRAHVGKHPYRLLPFRFDDQRGAICRPAPTLGEHNRHVIVDMLGFSANFYAELEKNGLIGTTPLGYED